jgi:hypothetical protein
MSEDSNYWDYWKKRKMEREIVELKDEMAELERTVEILDESDEPVEAEEE